MEPLSSAAIAISSLIFTKAFEKTGEKLGEAFTNQLGKFVGLMKRKSLPKTQEVDSGSSTANYDEAVQELQSAIQSDTELATEVSYLAKIVESNPVLYEKAQNTVTLVRNEPSIIQNQTKLAEKIGLVVQGGEVNIENLSF